MLARSITPVGLNELLSQDEGKLPPTDSRLRPDQRLCEIWRFGDANAEKQRLEKKQRAARKRLEDGTKTEPRWFRSKTGATDTTDWDYIGGYWEARRTGVYSGSQHITSGKMH